jgi:uncharacterized membrane protein YhaH (DUF805 family)
MKYYLKALRHYADFSGRASRKEYWMFILFNIIFTFAAAMAGAILALIVNEDFVNIYVHDFVALYYCAVIIPFLAVSVRRLHDSGKSGWWMLPALLAQILNIILSNPVYIDEGLILAISLIFFACSVCILVFMLLKSNNDANRYGANPKLIIAYGRQNTTKNLATAFIIISAAVISVNFFYAVESIFSQYLNFTEFIKYRLIPTIVSSLWLITMLIAGIYLLKGKNKTKQIAILLTAAAALWIVNFIYREAMTSFPYDYPFFSFTGIRILLDKLLITVPIALLMTGLAWLQKSGMTMKIKIQPALAAKCLIAVSIFYMFVICINALPMYEYDINISMIILMLQKITVLIPVLLLLLAVYMMPGQAALQYETSIGDEKEYENRQRPQPASANGSLGWKIFGLFVSIFFIIGGLSGDLVLRGTESSTALVILGIILFICDAYSIATHKKQKPESKNENTNENP